MNKQIWSTYLKLFYLTLNKVDEESEIDFTPNELLYSLRKTYKIYDIGNKQQQHDSHELLHSLLNRVYYHDALVNFDLNYLLIIISNLRIQFILIIWSVYFFDHN